MYILIYIHYSLFSLVVERQSCKLEVPSSILGKGIYLFICRILHKINTINIT